MGLPPEKEGDDVTIENEFKFSYVPEFWQELFHMTGLNTRKAHSQVAQVRSTNPEFLNLFRSIAHFTSTFFIDNPPPPLYIYI